MSDGGEIQVAALVFCSMLMKTRLLIVLLQRKLELHVQEDCSGEPRI